MKKWMLALLCVMLFLPICAQAAITFPADLTNIDESAFEGDKSLSGLVIFPGSRVTVGPRAFANTNIYALRLNGIIEENALENTYIAYIYTPESGGFHYTIENNFCFWFGTADSNIQYGRVSNEDLVEHDGFYYYCPYGWNSSPRYFLCPVDCVGLDKIEYIPGVDMTYAVMPHCEDVILGVPAGTTVPEGLKVQYYDRLWFNGVSLNTEKITTDVPFTFTADVTGGHGDVTVTWEYIYNDGEPKTVTGDTLTFTVDTPGTLLLKARATDSLGNRSSYENIWGTDWYYSYTIYPYSYQEPKLTSLTVNADELIINSPYTFTAGTSNVLDGTTYAWEIYAANGDLACSQTTSKPTLTWTPTVAGSYLVSVTTSTDVMGNNASIQEEFTFISDIKPIEVVALTANANTLISLNEYTFTCTTANSIGSVTYNWLFNDGGFEVTETTTKPSITFMPVFSGTLSVSVTATDANGSATLLRDFPIECTGLTMTRITPTEDTTLEPGKTYTFSNNAACSCAEISYEWTIVSDAGTTTATTTRASLDYKIPSTTALTVTCTATDSAGNSISLTNNYDLTPRVPITVNPLSVSGDLVLEAYITVSTTASGGNGALSYSWAITTPAGTSTTTSTSPSMSFYPGITGLYQITLTVSDTLGQTASVSTEFTIAAVETNPVTYRALLVGNTYPGTDNYLPGTDQDVYALSKVLKSMTSTPYTVTEKINVTASTIHSSITSAFAGADENDVSFFYYSGHGATNTGKLCGTNNTYISPSELRTWLDTIPGTKIVMLDSCYSGAHINKSDVADTEAFNNAIISAFSWTSKGSNDLASNGYIVLTACSKTQTSSSLTTTSDHSFGAFTYGLCYTGGYDHFQQSWFSQHSLYGDSNSNGYTSLGEALSVVKERINYLNSLMSDPMEQSVQYYGNTTFELWGK